MESCQVSVFTSPTVCERHGWSTTLQRQMVSLELASPARSGGNLCVVSHPTLRSICIESMCTGNTNGAWTRRAQLQWAPFVILGEMLCCTVTTATCCVAVECCPQWPSWMMHVVEMCLPWYLWTHANGSVHASASAEEVLGECPMSRVQSCIYL